MISIGSSPRARGTLSHNRQQKAVEQVHPRGRGEHSSSNFRSASLIGSSPRARGTPRHRRLLLYIYRFIPAGAGNTVTLFIAGAVPAVHPRGRGEHYTADGFSSDDHGSSPRARGTPRFADRVRTPRRFIPAGAGNTQPAAASLTHHPVHPRGRGEHGLIYDRSKSPLGSSPRARGTPASQMSELAKGRFIPAGAGNTMLLEICATNQCGSSPRARGTPSGRSGTGSRPRFIPAGAGNTPSLCSTAGCPAVHPRGRGEHITYHRTQPAGRGSSPRARGTQVRRQLLFDLKRFIPAGAGNTARSLA